MEENNYMEWFSKLKHAVQKLIEWRNTILNYYEFRSNEQNISDNFLKYTKQDAINSMEAIKRIRENGFLNPHYIWEIPKKTHKNQYYDKGELTE